MNFKNNYTPPLSDNCEHELAAKMPPESIRAHSAELQKSNFLLEAQHLNFKI